MKQDINIYVCANATIANPESYRLKVLYRDKQDARRVKKTFPRFENKKAAEKAKTQWILDYANDAGFFAPPVVDEVKEPEVLTFERYAEEYASWKADEIKGISFDYEMRNLIEHFGAMPLEAIRYNEVMTFRRSLEKPFKKEVKIKSPHLTLNPKTKRMRYEIETKTIEKRLADSTVNLFIKRLKNLMYEAWRSGRITESPQKIFHKAVKRENNKPTTAISFAECERLLAQCTGERAHLYAQVLCVFEAACRLSEYKAIRKRDLDIKTGFCWVNISKQKKNAKQRPPRRCYFSKKLLAAIVADGFEKKGANDFLFDQRDPKRAWATAKRLAFADEPDEARRELLLDLDLQRSLRKSARINYVKTRMLENVIDYQMSHAPTTTGRKHYDEISEEEQRAEFERYEVYSAAERDKIKAAAKSAAA
jgi:integrase